MKDRAAAVGMGDFLGAGNLERSLKSCMGGAETLAWGIQTLWYNTSHQLLEYGQIGALEFSRA